MPIYTFKCNQCTHTQTLAQKYDDPAPKCEVCNQTTERIISKSSFVLKGKGWFKTGGYGAS